MTQVKKARIVALNLRGGRITLDDDTAWRVAEDERALIRFWSEGQTVRVEPRDADKIFPFRLVDPETGIGVSVIRSQGRSPWPWMSLGRG